MPQLHTVEIFVQLILLTPFWSYFITYFSCCILCFPKGTIKEAMSYYFLVSVVPSYIIPCYGCQPNEYFPVSSGGQHPNCMTFVSEASPTGMN